MDLSLGRLIGLFLQWQAKEVAAQRARPATLIYYRRILGRFREAIGDARPAGDILPLEVELWKSGWHSVQAVQRLYNWGIDMVELPRNPFRKIKRPEPGQRRRILARWEATRLLRRSDRHFRPFLLALQHPLARPQEIRAFRWDQLVPQPVPMIVLWNYKARQRRKDHTSPRLIPLDARMVRLLARIWRRRPIHDPSPFIFTNQRGQAWTSNAVRLRIRRLCRRVGLGRDSRGEAIVAYTWRHTGATNAAANSVQEKILAEILGHTSTRTTNRYQHP